jgi:hypothetical protein
MTISSNCEYPVKNNRKVERELEKQTQYGIGRQMKALLISLDTERVGQD